MGQEVRLHQFYNIDRRLAAELFILLNLNMHLQKTDIAILESFLEIRRQKFRNILTQKRITYFKKVTAH